MTASAVSAVIHPDQIDTQLTESVLGSAVVCPADVGVFEINGPSAVDCLQGLLTADLSNAADHAFVYGAALTPKGMIVTDMWIARIGSTVWITVPRSGREPLAEVFGKYLPPRLATTHDRSDEYRTLRVVGPRAIDIGRAAGLDVPPPGRTSVTIAGGAEGSIACAPAHTDFALQIQIPTQSAEDMSSRLVAAGAAAGTADVLELSRILHGWPALGAEVGDKTLPQEVRFDEHGGISYTKGCYTGQETVARLHFRGHANRELVGLTWDAEDPDPSDGTITQDGTPVGEVTSLAWVEPIATWAGLGVLHRKANRDHDLVACGATCGVTAVPMHIRP